VNAASLMTPWGRPVFDGRAGGAADNTRGWKTGVDVGAKVDIPLDPNDINHLRMESEFMYITWARNFKATSRHPYLEGYGVLWGIRFRHNFTPKVEGAGIFPLFKFSYSDVDNKETDDAFGNIRGQRVWCYTFGLGYAFNRHFSMQFNYLLVTLDEPNFYNTVTNVAKYGQEDGSDDIEQAWFFQVTAQW